jgi:HEAT repeat protein
VDSALLQKVEQPPKTVATKKLGANVSIRYDTAACLAYGKTDESVDFETFRKKHEQLTVATITAKKME